MFFGPIGHKERCVTVKSEDDDNFKPMSPLNGEQIAELFKEATAVSIFIKNSSSNTSLGNNENENCDKENNDICNILSQTFSVDDDQSENDLIQKPDQEDDLRIAAKSASSPESVLQENFSMQPEPSDDIVTAATPKRILQERNSQDQTSMSMPSPFKVRKARPLQNTSKFTNSRLPKTQMTLKTRSCFNSVSIVRI